MDVALDTPRRTEALTLAIDIGGTRLKAGVLDPAGIMVDGPQRVDTPPRPTPATVLEALAGLVATLGHFDRISCGFPGVVRHGRVLTAPNLGTAAWHAFPLAAELTERFGRPTRLLNDAEVQGLGVITSEGLECVITLGTGMGFSLFQDGGLTPHLELSHHPIRKDRTYDQFIGNAALVRVGRKRWNRRLRRALECIERLVGYDSLYIGGGNARHVKLKLATNVRLVSNDAGITGGVRLWDAKLDPMFAVMATAG